MQLRAEEISNIIKQQIASYDKTVDVMVRPARGPGSLQPDLDP